MSKRPKLSDFTQQPAEKLSESLENQHARRRKIKGDVVGMTVRLTRADWERIHIFALSEGVSLQQLVFEGLSRLLTDKGLPGLSGKE